MNKTRFSYPLLLGAVLGVAAGMFSPPVLATEAREAGLPKAAPVCASELQVSRRGDLEMSCGGLSQEAALMRDIITTTQDIKDNSAMASRGVNVAGAAAGFLVGTVTGGLGIAAAGFLLDEAVDDRAENADAVQDIAAQRRILMTGIFNAKGCNGPIEHVMHDPADTRVAPDVLASVSPAAGDSDADRMHLNE